MLGHSAGLRFRLKGCWQIATCAGVSKHLRLYTNILQDCAGRHVGNIFLPSFFCAIGARVVGESETLQVCRQGALRHPRGRIERSARINFQSVPRVAVSAIWLRFRLTLRHLDAVLTHRQNYLGKRGRRKPGRGTKATFQPCLA